MTLECVNPEDLPAPSTYTHVVVATGSRLVFVAGRALDAAAVRPEDVTKITIFVVGYRREQLPVIEHGRVALFGDHKPADTIGGVEALSRPEYLIEAEATAVVDTDGGR
jgi:hypothetical protein